MKKIITAFLFVGIFAGIAAAHPPTDLKLQYDTEQQLLSVYMRHVTIERLEHYVRFISVTVNQQAEPQVFRYTKQDQPSVVDVLLPVKAAPGDIIHVQASCIKGGSIEGELQLPKEEVKEEKKEEVKPEPTGEEEAPDAVNKPYKP